MLNLLAWPINLSYTRDAIQFFSLSGEILKHLGKMGFIFETSPNMTFCPKNFLKNWGEIGNPLTTPNKFHSRQDYSFLFFRKKKWSCRRNSTKNKKDLEKTQSNHSSDELHTSKRDDVRYIINVRSLRVVTYDIKPRFIVKLTIERVGGNQNAENVEKNWIEKRELT